MSAPNGKNIRGDWAITFTQDFEKYIIYADSNPTIKKPRIELLHNINKEIVQTIIMVTHSLGIRKKTAAEFLSINDGNII